MTTLYTPGRCARNRLPATVFRGEKCSYEIWHSFRLRQTISISIRYIMSCSVVYCRRCLYSLECGWDRGGSVARVAVDWCSGPAVIDRRRPRLYIIIYIILRRGRARKLFTAKGMEGRASWPCIGLKRNSRRCRRWRWRSGCIYMRACDAPLN